jgi:hypothetical protein
MIPKKPNKPNKPVETKNYLGNSNLKASDVPIQFTKHQLEEYARCQRDPVYFIRNYVKIISLDKGLVPFDLYDFQEEIVQSIHNNRFVIAKLPRQTGKCFDIYTKVNVRNKKTGEVREMTVGELYDNIKTNQDQKLPPL